MSVLWLLFQVVFHNWQKSGILVSLVLTEFYSYGQIYNWLDQHRLAGIDLGRHIILLPAVIIITVIVTVLLFRAKKISVSITQFLNIFGSIACLIPVVTVLPSIYKTELFNPAHTAQAVTAQVATKYPDIYYIILDGYARADFLQKDFNYDNSQFIDSLTGMGFQLPSCSQSNYSVTRMSLTSSLNMDYLQPLLASKGIPWNDNINKSQIIDLLDHNLVRSELEALGYRTYAFETGYRFTEWKDADVYLTNGKDLLAFDKYLTERPDNFESLLIQSTGLRILMDLQTPAGQKLNALTKENEKLTHYNQVMYTLSQLPDLPPSDNPRFIFAHIVIPHYPYIVSPDGKLIYKNVNENPGYIDQIKFLNTRIPEILTRIIHDSKIKPVIILQGDHGLKRFGPDDVKILNAYYLGGRQDISIDRGITPVNTFRLIMNTFFGKNEQLLPDQSFYSAEDNFYQITSVDKSCPH
jgi:hypothetical protein